MKLAAACNPLQHLSAMSKVTLATTYSFAEALVSIVFTNKHRKHQQALSCNLRQPAAIVSYLATIFSHLKQTGTTCNHLQPLSTTLQPLATNCNHWEPFVTAGKAHFQQLATTCNPCKHLTFPATT
jgi:hypothetical protein